MQIKSVQQGVDGMLYYVLTDRGNYVKVWRSVYNVGSYTHFCHGYSLGTFKQYGFSVLGGPNMDVLLRDEYNQMDAFQIIPGDIIVFRGNLCGTMEGITHSALIERVGTNPYESTRLDSIYVSSKSGFEPIHAAHTLREEVARWGNKFSFYRKK